MLIPYITAVSLYFSYVFIHSHMNMCKTKSITALLLGFFNLLISLYVVISPFVLKDYIYHLVFTTSMIISWFVMKKYYTGTKLCIIEHARRKVCNNDIINEQNVAYKHVLFTSCLVIYDIFMLSRG